MKKDTMEKDTKEKDTKEKDTKKKVTKKKDTKKKDTKKKDTKKKDTKKKETKKKDTKKKDTIKREIIKRDIRKEVIDASLKIFGEKGCKFTLDDIEIALKMSRRTIYKYFRSKDEILTALIDEASGEIFESQKRIFDDKDLSLRQKLYNSLTVEPRQEHFVSTEELYKLEKFFPEVYEYFIRKYEEEWSLVSLLLEQGIKEGVFRPCNIDFVKALLQNGMQMLHHGDFLIRNNLTYKEALHQLVEIVIDGITLKED